jgi:exosortase A-associated hydrolase 2
VLAVVLWEPAYGAVRNAALCLPPFGDEMNKSRRMVAMQARALASSGWAVAVLDPRGTGDSEGEHGDATWQGWRDDACCAWDWLARRFGTPVMLWGLRTGALLAMDLTGNHTLTPAVLLLWQPVASGRTFFDQLLRAAKARDFAAPGGAVDGSIAPREAVRMGKTISIGGYDLHPDLIAGAGRADQQIVAGPGMRVIVREVTIAVPPSLSPGVQRIVARWHQAGAAVDVEAVGGASFWAAQEIVEVQALIESSTVAVLGHATNAPAAAAT